MRLLTSIALAFALAFVAGAASATSINMTVSNNGGGTQVGNDVEFAAGGGTVVYNLSITTTEATKGVGVSASFLGGTGSGTNAGALIDFGTFTVMGLLGTGVPAGTFADSLIGWNYGTVGTALPAGTYSLGTLTVNATGNTDVVFGLVRGVDVIQDVNFNPIPGVTSASAAITVVPEPGTALLMGLGIVGLAFAGRRD